MWKKQRKRKAWQEAGRHWSRQSFVRDIEDFRRYSKTEGIIEGFKQGYAITASTSLRKSPSMLYGKLVGGAREEARDQERDSSVVQGEDDRTVHQFSRSGNVQKHLFVEEK